MTELDAVLTAYRVSVNCREIVLDLLEKSTKAAMFHGTVFVNKPRDEAKQLLAQSKTEMDDLTIVSLVSAFERIIFNHPNSLRRAKSVRKRIVGLHDAIKLFQQEVSQRVYEDTERLCGYRDWVAHGRRWNQPVHADPVSTHQQLVEFLNQTGLGTRHRMRP